MLHESSVKPWPSLFTLDSNPQRQSFSMEQANKSWVNFSLVVNSDRGLYPTRQ
jgi:hypothetical protein